MKQEVKQQLPRALLPVLVPLCGELLDLCVGQVAAYDVGYGVAVQVVLEAAAVQCHQLFQLLHKS